MEVISSIYNSGYNIKKFYLGSRELNLAYLGNQVIYDEVIGDNDLNYILYEFYGSDTLPNTVEAPVKSAILKGQTLVNIADVSTMAAYNGASISDETIILDRSINTSLVQITSANKLIQSGKKYIAILNEINGNTQGVILKVQRRTSIETVNFVNNRAIFIADTDVYNRWVFVEGAFLGSDAGTTSFKWSIIEYQEGMENWDIPYFEGMQSVKMPVLKTLNKQHDALTLLFNQTPWNKWDWSTLSFVETFNGRFKVKFKDSVSSTLRFNIFTTEENTLEENTFTNEELKNGIDVYFTEVKHIGFHSLEDGIQYGKGIDIVKEMINNGDIEFKLYEDGFKSNILTVNEDVTLRSNGDVYDELNLLTGRLTQRIDENNEVLAQEVVKTVDLTIVDQDGKTINKLNSFNGTTYVSTEVAENSAYPMVSLEVASELQAAMSKVAEDIELIKPVQNDIETTLDTKSNDIDSLLLATTELFEMFL